jgi:hypothetical protein
MARGLNEHAAEGGRQSVVRINAVTKIPRSRIKSGMSTGKARPGAQMMAMIKLADKAIALDEYGDPRWVRDLNPMAGGHRGGPVSSMAGAEAMGWGNRRIHRGTFVAKGKVWVRRPDGSLRRIYSTVLANELAKPNWTNAKGAEKYMQLDLERRVNRHLLRDLG